jgi:methylated-DNA-[protein]-cysteine S-methyltransferase
MQPAYAAFDGPLGQMLLEARAGALSGLYFTGQKDCPPLAGLPPVLPDTRDPSSGVLDDGRPIRRVRMRKADLADTRTARAACGALCYPTGEPAAPARDVFDAAHAQLQAYFRGELHDFDLPLDARGTPFQERVWQALLDIPYGVMRSYGELALAMGLTAGHSRAVGTAVGRNPLTIIIPCHRVLAGNGTLNGYTGGLARKAALLQIEGYALS